MNQALRMQVTGASRADSNRLAEDLERWLKSRCDQIDLQRLKEDAESQDAGTVLVAILAAPAVVALAKDPALELAKGVADWLRKRKASLTITPDGGITVENVSADDVKRIIMGAFKEQRRP